MIGQSIYSEHSDSYYWLFGQSRMNTVNQNKAFVFRFLLQESLEEDTKNVVVDYSATQTQTLYSYNELQQLKAEEQEGKKILNFHVR